MSKATLKKELLSLTQEQLVEQILDLYQANKSVKEFYEFYLNPVSKEKDLFEKYKQIIVKEFHYDGGSRVPRTRFAVAKKAISDFKALKPSPELIADLMMTLAEEACEFSYDIGDLWEGYYTSTENNFDAALKFIAKLGLLEQFKSRAKQCVKWSEPCGYGFCDAIPDIYYDYYTE